VETESKNQNFRVAPLRPVLAFEYSFSWVIVDCVRLLPKAK
jgi:hypothetical protein